MPSFGTILIGYLLIVTLVILGFLKDVSEKIKIWHMCINFVVITLFALMRSNIPTSSKGKTISAAKYRWAKYIAIIILCSFIITLTNFSTIDKDLKTIGYIYPGIVILLSLIAAFMNPLKIEQLAKQLNSTSLKRYQPR